MSQTSNLRLFLELWPTKCILFQNILLRFFFQINCSRRSQSVALDLHAAYGQFKWGFFSWAASHALSREALA